jgi:iron complex transport system substrate-binding protein
MKNKVLRSLICILVIVLVAALVAGCGSLNNGGKKTEEISSQDNNKEAVYPLTVKDQMGRDVTIEKLPERIISLAPSNTEILFALGLGEKVVGVTDYCDYPDEAKTKEKIGGFADPNMEKVISLKPDLVLATGMHQKPVEQLEKLNVPVIVLNPGNIQGMLNSIEIIGTATGRLVQAKELVNSLKARINNVEGRVAGLVEKQRLKVYYEVWPSPYTTAGPGTFVNDIIEKAGGQNIAADADKQYPQYSQEMIIAKNPDIIIFSHHGSTRQSADDILKRPGWENISAIKNKKVFYVDEDIVQRATPRLVDGLERFAEIIHPELFKK